MSDFILAEKANENQKNLSTLARLVNQLSIVKWLLVPNIIGILIAALLPQFFLWYLAKLTQCQTAITNGLSEGQCTLAFAELAQSIGLNTLELPVIAVSISGLVYIAFLGVVVRMITWAGFELPGQWSTQVLHRSMMRGIQQVRTTYFDENPSGRLITRIVSDFDNIRGKCIERLDDATNCLFEALAVGVIAYIAHPVAGLGVFPVVACYLYLQWYVAPIKSHGRSLRSVRLGYSLHRVTDLIDGKEIFEIYSKVDALTNRIQRAYLGLINQELVNGKLNAWSNFITQNIGLSYSLLVYTFVILSLQDGQISIEIAAVILTAVLSMNTILSALSWHINFLGESASNVGRAFELVDLIPEAEEERVALNNPQMEQGNELNEGDIEFKNYTMSYRKEGEIILQDLNVRFEKGLRIGIVGRTGAGKSSLIQALFRMVYVHQGDITIDGRSIFDYSVDDVRALFSVIPQDPYLFGGDVRLNLQGFGQSFPDAQLTSALNVVGLDLPLDHKVVEGGSNLSLGQKQLLCFARLWLRRRPFILMDEPTSAVDVITDQKIQDLLHNEFHDETVITIAHRVNTLSRYDKIIEMANGKVISVR